jgi:hypothetical protein
MVTLLAVVLLLMMKGRAVETLLFNKAHQMVPMMPPLAVMLQAEMVMPRTWIVWCRLLPVRWTVLRCLGSRLDRFSYT